MKKKLYNYIFRIFAPLLLIIASTANSDSKVTVISSTVDQLHFTIKIDKSSLSVLPTLDNHQLFYKSLKIVVPQNSQVVIKSVNGLSLDKFETSEKDQAVYQVNDLAEISTPKNWRGANLATLSLYPVVGDQYYTELEVVISFSAASNSKPFEQPFDSNKNSLLKAAVINNNILGSSLVRQNISAKPTEISGPFDSFSDWVKIETAETGLCRVTVSQLSSAGLDVSNLPIDQIHLYNGGGKEQEVLNEFPRSEFTEIAITVVDDGDNLFNNQDQILFYCESLERFAIDNNKMKYVRHHFTNYNIY